MAQLVALLVANEVVVSSNLITDSIICVKGNATCKPITCVARELIQRVMIEQIIQCLLHGESQVHE